MMEIVEPPVLLAPGDRLAFERRLQHLRLGLLCGVVLTPLAFGSAALMHAAFIGAGVLGTHALVTLLLRRQPHRLSDWQLLLRVLDCVLAFLLLTSIHALVRNAYYDAAYLFFVVAGAATHGHRGALALAGLAASCVFGSRLLLISQGLLMPEARHVTDSIFYLIFFGATGLATVFLMERAGEVVARRALAMQQEREAFLLTLSHDLRNPLTVLKGQVQGLLRRLEKHRTIEPDALVSGLTRMGHAATRMSRQVDEVLDLAQAARSGVLTLNRRDVDLVVLAERAVEVYATVSEAHQVRLRTDVPSLVGTWDAGRLERVLDNLLANAIKYAPAGGDVVVSVRHTPPARGAVDGWALLEVQDHGIGIPAAELGRLFEPFWRGSNVRGRVQGMGLGLASVRQIAEQHGGDVGVASEPGRGTTVTVRLPVAARGNDSPTGGGPASGSASGASTAGGAGKTLVSAG